MLPLKPAGENLSLLIPCCCWWPAILSSPWQSLARSCSSSTSSSVVSLLPFCVCQYLFYSEGSSYKISAILMTSFYTWLYLQKTLEIWLHSQVLGVRALTYLFGGHNSTHNTLHLCFSNSQIRIREVMELITQNEVWGPSALKVWGSVCPPFSGDTLVSLGQLRSPRETWWGESSRSLQDREVMRLLENMIHVHPWRSRLFFCCCSFAHHSYSLSSFLFV